MSVTLTNIIGSYKIAISIYAFLSTVDLALTRYSMVYLGAREANPIMDFMFSQSLFGATAFKLGILLMVGIVCVQLWEHRQIRIVLALGNLVMLGVIVYELANILGVRGV